MKEISSGFLFSEKCEFIRDFGENKNSKCARRIGIVIAGVVSL
jgi:hypothetical protein